MSAAKTAIIEDIVDQYFDEASFLWTQREAATTSANYSLKDLAYADSRVEAHIDGLRIAGEHGWGLCEDGIDPGDPGTVFTSSVIAFESGDGDKIKFVVDAASESYEAFRAAVSGLGWMEQRRFNSIITELVSHKSRRHRRLAIAACGIRRINPRAYLDQAIQSSDLFLKATALSTAGKLKRKDLLPQLQKHFQHEDHACRFAAAKSALLLGDHSAIDILKAFALSKSDFTQPALQCVLRVVDVQTTRSWLQTLAKDPEQRRLTIVAVAYTGDPAYVTMLLKQLDKPEFARIAGESFSIITGVDFVMNKLDTEKPEALLTGPSDDPEDDDVAMDADDDLPWPDAEGVKHWWQQNKGSFPVGVRHLSGSPISQESCVHILTSGNQQQRYAASLEVALSNPDAALLNTKAPGFRQATGF